MADSPIMEKNNLAALENECPEKRKVDVDLEAPADFTSRMCFMKSWSTA